SASAIPKNTPGKNPMKAIDNFLAESQPLIIEELKAFLRIPSISADPAFQPSVREAATFVAERLAEAGCTAQLVETQGNPIVLGRSPRIPNAPTILVYGHYDV